MRGAAHASRVGATRGQLLAPVEHSPGELGCVRWISVELEMELVAADRVAHAVQRPSREVTPYRAIRGTTNSRSIDPPGESDSGSECHRPTRSSAPGATGSAAHPRSSAPESECRGLMAPLMKRMDPPGSFA